MLVALHDVVYRYEGIGLADGRPPALDGVTMSVGEGSVVALLGSSGSGRSTLLALLNGLLKPSSGRVLIDGLDVAARETNAAALRRQVGLLMQNADDQLFGATVAEDVAFGPNQLGLTTQEVASRVREALYSVELPLADVGARSPFSLSGGQRRRVAIAGILAMRPRLLVLDEPLAGLDPEGKVALLEMLRALRQRYSLTIIMATKDVASALAIAEAFVVLHQGRIVLDGDRASLVNSLPRLAELGLELPTQSRVLLALRARGWHVPPIAESLDAAAEAIALAAPRYREAR